MSEENQENIERNPVDYYARRKMIAFHQGKRLTVENVLNNLSEFKLFSDYLEISFPDFTIEGFKNWGESLGLFTKTYILLGEEFQIFSSVNADVFGEIIDRARALCEAPAEAEFRSFRLSVNNRTLKITFHLNGRTYRSDFDGDTYNQLIIDDVAASSPQHPSLVEIAVYKSFQIAFTKEPDYWNSTVLYTE